MMRERRGDEEGGGEEHVPKGGEAVVNSGVEGEGEGGGGAAARTFCETRARNVTLPIFLRFVVVIIIFRTFFEVLHLSKVDEPQC